MPSHLILTGIRGRDGSTADIDIPMSRCSEAMNVDWYQSPLGRKRGGSASVSTTGGTAFSGTIASLFRYVPGADESAAQLWGVDSAGLVKRLSAGTSWADVTLADSIQTKTQDVNCAVLNGKLFMAYDSAVDRLHVWDGTTHRRVGLKTPAAAPTTSTSGGAVTDTRTYKVAWVTQSGGITIRRSELSSASTPVVLSTNKATVTRPTAAGESETHWELYAASTDGVYYLLATTAIATTTCDDNNATLSGTAAPLAGTNTVPTSWKYLLSDGNRLIGAGSWESGGKNNRVWFTPVLGSSDVGDDERVPNTTEQENWIDLDENDGGFITGLGGPIQGAVWVFKYRQIWKLVPTGKDTAPYRPYCISKKIGCIAQKSIVLSEDEHGDPALYFWSHRGPYRLGAQGLQYLGRDVQDLVVNRAATNVAVHAIEFSDKHQIWWWIATGSSNDPDVRLAFDFELGTPDGNAGVRGGWSRANGGAAAARCSAMFSNTPGASMSLDLKPHFGRTTGTALWKGDSGTDDAGTTFAAYVQLPARHLGGLHKRCAVREAVVLASANSQTLRLTLTTDYGVQTVTSDATFTPAGSETRLPVLMTGSFAADAYAVAITVGDDTARSNSWSLDAVTVPYEAREDVAS